MPAVALAGHAARTGASVTSALELLILEATRAADFPGIVYRGPVGARRAAIAGGPDVWEVVARIQEVSGTLNARVDQVHAESGLAPSLVQLAIEFAAAHPDEIAQSSNATRQPSALPGAGRCPRRPARVIPATGWARDA